MKTRERQSLIPSSLQTNMHQHAHDSTQIIPSPVDPSNVHYNGGGDDDMHVEHLTPPIDPLIQNNELDLAD